MRIYTITYSTNLTMYPRQTIELNAINFEEVVNHLQDLYPQAVIYDITSQGYQDKPLQRYYLTKSGVCDCLLPSDNGEWVKHEDIKHLL